MSSFADKWLDAQKQNNSRLALGLAPQIARMPAPIARYDDPFLPFGRAMIECSVDLVCAYVFDLASYLALGAAGARALERTIPLVPRHIPTIIHAPFATAGYVQAVYENAFAADAVTLATSDPEVICAYSENPAHGVFVLNGDQPLAENTGCYNDTGLRLGETRALWIAEAIIYASGRSDFQPAAREAAGRCRIESLQR